MRPRDVIVAGLRRVIRHHVAASTALYLLGASHLAALSALHTEWGAAGRSYWLPLENFSVASFNRLLSHSQKAASVAAAMHYWSNAAVRACFFASSGRSSHPASSTSTRRPR